MARSIAVLKEGVEVVPSNAQNGYGVGGIDEVGVRFNIAHGYTGAVGKAAARITVVVFTGIGPV